VVPSAILLAELDILATVPSAGRTAQLARLIAALFAQTLLMLALTRSRASLSTLLVSQSLLPPLLLEVMLISSRLLRALVA